MHVCTDWYLSRLELHRLAESIGYLHRKVKIVIDGLRDPVERVGFWMKIHSRSSSNTIDVNMEELTPFPRGMRLLQGIYTIRHNARHRLRGQAEHAN
jgi:hypothetical protein